MMGLDAALLLLRALPARCCILYMIECRNEACPAAAAPRWCRAVSRLEGHYMYHLTERTYVHVAMLLVKNQVQAAAYSS